MVDRASLGALAWARHDELLELIAMRSEAVAERLEVELGLVAWDRQVVIGRAQRDLRRLAEEPGRSDRSRGATPGVRVRERRRQPLESLPLLWGALLNGQRVSLELEEGASPAVLELLRPLRERLRGDGESPLILVGDGGQGSDGELAAATSREEIATWPEIGVKLAEPRIAVVGGDGDRELAAYVLARTCLRRAGEEPRTIHHALVCGPTERLERYLQRLWVGVVIGPASDPGSFSGPVTPGLAHAYLGALERWRALAGVRVLCPGGRLYRAEDDALYLAPALLRVPWSAETARPPVVGPMLVLHRLADGDLAAALTSFGIPAGRQLWIAPKPLGGAEPAARYVGGALVVERMPPGLPEPRPV